VQPYDNRGRKVPLACPRENCGAGKLQYEGDGYWRCDGLADPGSDDKPLEACTYVHQDGTEYVP
jgi:hypothetical protein